MLLVANWKAYVEDSAKAKRLFAVSKKISRTSTCAIVLAPPAPFLGTLAPTNKSSVAFSAQDVSLTAGGAHTGEVTAAMSASTGASYTLVGHSERRMSGDTTAIVAEKIRHAFACSLTPILCIGEKERDTEGRYLSFIREEITSALSSLTPKERLKIIIAYEPLWAIGKNALSAIQPHDLVEMVLYIHKVLAELLPGKNSQHVRILYGGSVEPGNIRDLARVTHIDGFLVGRASVDEQIFTALIKQLA
ncbi:MAG TPA: triose-phosphate isomerase [Candidatus Paceibacterota bacterium]|nr:triose-phosphate isomerase [Candidatus Paceibacterota bacterium]